MLHSLTKIQWMDVKSKRVYTDCLDKMFQMYAHLTKVKDGIDIVIIDPKYSLVKIRDMNGWTDVKSITRIQPVTNWLLVEVAGNKLVISPDTDVPIYDPTHIVKGFHGETKYYFKPIQISIVENDDMMRVKSGTDEFGNDVEFAKVVHSGTAVDFHESSHGYNVVTKSGFFNANNIHLFSQYQKSSL